MKSRKFGLYIILIGSAVCILFPPYTFRGHEGYNFIFGKVKEIGFWVSRETSVFNVIDYKTLIFQLLIINLIGVASIFLYTNKKTIKRITSQEKKPSKKIDSAIDIDL